MDIIIMFKGGHMLDTCWTYGKHTDLISFDTQCCIHMSFILLTVHCCAMPHGYHILLCNTSPITHVEHSRTTYIRIPWNASPITHVLYLVYIVYQVAYLFFSLILLGFPLYCGDIYSQYKLALSSLILSLSKLISLCEPTIT